MTKYEKAAVEVIARVIQEETEHQWHRRNGYIDDDTPNTVSEQDIELAKQKLFNILDNLLNPPANYS